MIRTGKLLKQRISSGWSVRGLSSKKSSSPRDALEDVVNLCKRRGFVFPSGEIYGGMGWDLGPLGTQLKKNLVDLWWKSFVEQQVDCVGLDTSIILHPEVWRASGHVDEFTDPLTECGACHRRYRADHLLPEVDIEDMEDGQVHKLLQEVDCPGCGKRDFGVPRQFNLLFETNVGPVVEASSKAYLRPETAQGAYTQYALTSTLLRSRLPLGLAQVGRSFRNEIATSNFLFRTREFDQAELQYFCHPDSADVHFQRWVDFSFSWLIGVVGLRPENLRKAEFGPGEGAHYARQTVDIEYRYPFGWGELWGIANRGDYDLQQHANASKRDLRWKDPTTGQVSYFFMDGG